MEEMAIIRYFLENGGYVSQRGNAIWKMMEEWKVCPDRTWMSMKHHWDKWIHPQLNNFGVTEEELVAVDEREENKCLGKIIFC